MRVLLVDDEPLANEGLRTMLQRYSDVRVIGVSRDGRDAIEQIRRHVPDVAFLDVQMPELDAFDVLREIGDNLVTMIVFVTAHDEYALRAFDVHAIDYLLKPVHATKLDSTIDHLRKRLDESRAIGLSQQLAALLADDDLSAHGFAAKLSSSQDDSQKPQLAPSSYLSRVTVRIGRRSLAVPVADIEWITADDYCVNMMVQGKRYMLRASLASLEAKLDPATFVRVHRSALVNITMVKEWHQRPLRRLVLVLADRTQLPVSRSRRAQVLERLTGHG